MAVCVPARKVRLYGRGLRAGVRHVKICKADKGQAKRWKYRLNVRWLTVFAIVLRYGRNKSIQQFGPHMKNRSLDERKAYGTQRMLAAIERAIEADTDTEKERAARWATAWGALGGIRSPGMRLRRSVLADPPRPERRVMPR